MPVLYQSQFTQYGVERNRQNYYYYYYYYYMIYIAPISRIESEALASLGGEHD